MFIQELLLLLLVIIIVKGNNDQHKLSLCRFPKYASTLFLEKRKGNCILSFHSGDEAENGKKEEIFSTVRPEEIPDVPSNKFLSRDPPPPKDKDKQEPR